jgi:hypothetical protein
MGMSPMKKGPPKKIPDTLLKVVATNTEVCQVGEGELRWSGHQEAHRSSDAWDRI